MTVIQNLNQSQWTEEALSVFPLTWVSDVAQQPGGVLYAVFFGIAATFVALNAMALYANAAGLITTATDTELDLASKDFFGNGVPRLPGESDINFRARLINQLLVPYITRPAFIQQITALIGPNFVLVEPWIAGQTSAYDYSYYDWDSPQTHGVYGAPDMKYQVAIDAVLPPVIIAPYGPVYSYDGGAAYDAWTGSYGADNQTGNPGAPTLDALLNKIKAAGITVWRKYLNKPPTSFGVHAFQLSVTESLFQIPHAAPNNQPYYLFLSPNWMANVWIVNVGLSGFEAQASAPTPALGGLLNALFVPTTGQPGVGQAPVTMGASGVTITTAQGSSAIYAFTPNWDTEYWITSQSSTAVTLAFSTAAPAGAYVNWFNLGSTSGTISPAIGDTSATVTIPNVPLCPFAVGNWNTQISVSAVDGVLTLNFNTAAPSGAKVYWGWSTETF